jgi:uncharacterized membrane protein YfcA
MTGVLIGGQLGPIVNRIAPVSVLKVIFSIFVFLTGTKMIYDNIPLIVGMFK